MALNSMTGFARAEGARDGYRWFWELRSVNGRGLDIRTRVPPGLGEIDIHVRARLQSALARGSVQVNLQTQTDEQQAAVRVNLEALEAIMQSAASIQQRYGAAPATLDGLLALKGVVDVAERATDEAETAARHEAMKASFDTALQALQQARREEGEHLHAAVMGQVDTIAALTERAANCSARMPEAIKARLADQVSRLLDASSQLDPARLHQEAVLLATRADVTEELDRLRAHVVAARSMIEADGAIGRRLDFLAQEFGREANTLCSKAVDGEMSAIGLELKAVIDQFKEQVQNIE